MPSSDPRLKTPARKALRRAVALERRGCERPDCKHPGVPIDYSGRPGPLAYELDEIVPRADGGSPIDRANVRPAHADCNRAAGARMTNARRGAPPVLRAWTSGRW